MKKIKRMWKNIFSKTQILWKWCSSFIRENVIIIILVLIYIFLHSYWENWIDVHIVKTFFKDFKSNLLYDIIAIVVAAVCLCQIRIKNVKTDKGKTVLKNLIALVIWIYYRWYSDRFNLVSLSISEYFKYFDIVFVVAISMLIPFCIKFILFCFGKFKSNVHSELDYGRPFGFARNLPIYGKQDDFLERDKFVQYTVRELLETNTSEVSFTYGINAPWGTGKTSFINLMKCYLESDYIITIDFNPWLYAAEKDLVTALFDELSNTLKQYDRSLGKKLIDYSKLLSAFGTPETKMISSLLGLARKEDGSLKEKKRQITEAIKKIKKRIVIFIDDLDRLEADEILEMLKLIRNISDFPNMYIVAAYDKAYVIKCIEEKIKFGSINYIDKIFEHEYSLTPCSNESLRRALVDKLKRGIHLDSDGLFNYIMNHDNKVLNALSDLREVYRLSNRIVSAYKLSYSPEIYSSRRIHKIDLLLFEFFKMKYPVVYSLFEQKWHEILEPDPQVNNSFYKLYRSNNVGGYLDFIQYLRYHQKDMCVNEFDINTIDMIFSELFEQQDNGKDEGFRIRNTKWFNRYLNLTQLKTDITEHEFDEVMNKDDFGCIKTAFDDWSVNKSISLKYWLENYYKVKMIKSKQLKNNIKGIFYALHLDYKDYYFNYDELTQIISQLKKFNEDKENTQTNRDFILDQLTRYGENYFLCNYIGYLHKSKKYVEIGISESELIDVQKTLFQDCCKDYIGWVIQDFSAFLRLDEISSNDEKFIDKDDYVNCLIEIMREYAKDHIVGFVNQLFGKDSTKGLIIFFRTRRIVVKLVWGSWDGFMEFLSENGYPNQAIEELKNFYRQYENKGFKPIEFDFKHIQPVGTII